MSELPAALSDWLTLHADSLDVEATHAQRLVPLFAEHQLLHLGVPREWGGLGGSSIAAFQRVSDVAERSLTAGFVLWAQRTFIEYLLLTPNAALRQAWLPRLLSGEQSGATGLSNAIKFLAGIEELQSSAQRGANGTQLQLDGKAPWVTNTNPSGFQVAVAARGPEPGSTWILAIPSDAPGVRRSDDLRLLGLRGSHTAALEFDQVPLSSAHVLHEDARRFIREVRPVFLALQCGLALGLARRSLAVAHDAKRVESALLQCELGDVKRDLDRLVGELEAGLASGQFLEQPERLFTLRMGFAEAADAAVRHELCASGGVAYLSEKDRGFARRWREAAFLPILTPSLLQLKQELQRHRQVA